MTRLQQEGLGFRLLLRENPTTALAASLPQLLFFSVGLFGPLVMFPGWIMKAAGIATVTVVFLLWLGRRTRLDLVIEGPRAQIVRNEEVVWTGPTSELEVEPGSPWTVIAGQRRFEVTNPPADQRWIEHLRGPDGDASDVPEALRRARHTEQ